MRAEIESLLHAERYQAAAAKLAELPEPGSASNALLVANVLASVGRLDEANLAALAHLASPARLPDGDRDGIFAVVVRLYGSKRLARLARAVLARGREICGDGERLTLAEGEVALALDDREQALALFTQQHQRAATAATFMSLARVCFVQGDFAAARGHLGSICDDPGRGPRALRLLASIHSAERDFAAEAAAWAKVMALRPDGDFHATDGINHAFALAAHGQREAARAAFDAVFRAHPDSKSGGYARSRRDHLAQAGPSAKRKVLDFPRTQQKRDFCGPACVELCLRALGIELGQDEIAREIKRATGTPMYEIVSFLRARGVVARRFVATDERITAAVDLGLPVILQEEYSTTSHVAVVIGYDQALGVLILQDPMTHATSTRPMGWSTSSGQLYGCGAVVVLGRDDADLAGILAQAEHAGLVEAEHLVLLDQCSRRRNSLSGERPEEARAEEILGLTNRVLAVAPDFRLAYLHKLAALRRLWNRDRRAGNRADFLATLYQARTRFPDDEWPCQEQGFWHLCQGSFAESFAAYLAAHRRDPGDGNNLTYMGECQRKLGRFPAAEHALLQGLQNHADRGLAEWMLAALYLRELERLDTGEAPDDQARTLPAFVREFVVDDPKTVEQGLARTRDELLARAEYYNEICRELEPNNPYHHEVLGFLQLRRGAWPAAAEAFNRAFALAPSRWYANLGRAVACEAMGRVEEARAICAEACTRYDEDPDAYVFHAACLGRTGAKAEAVRVLADALAKMPESREPLVAPLLAALCATGTTEEAAARLREMLGRFPTDEAALSKAAKLVDEKKERGHAIALLRKAADHGNEMAKMRLGRMLVEHLPTRPEGIALLAAAAQGYPRWGYARRPLALAYLHTDPAQGLAVLAAMADDDDAWTHEARAVLLQATGDQAGAEQALRRALACFDGSEVTALADFADWHMDNHRYARAVELAHRMYQIPHEPKDLPRMEWIFLTAHRLAGRAQDILEWVRERCPGNQARADLAWQIYYGFSTTDHALAAGAARALAARQQDETRKTAWRIREAGQLACLGDDTAMTTEWQNAKSVDAWATLSDILADLTRYELANQAAERAHALAPEHAGALATLCHARQRQGDHEGALGAAQALLERYPYDHRGAELLGFLHARRMQVDAALAMSERALDAAPYCHNAYEARAMALFAAGRSDEARLHAEQALAISPEPEVSASESRLIVYSLGEARELAQRCFEKIPQGTRDLGAAFYARLLDTTQRYPCPILP